MEFSALHDLRLGEGRGKRLGLVMIQLIMPVDKTQQKLYSSKSILIAERTDIQGGRAP